MGLNHRASVRIVVPMTLAFALAGCGSFGAIGLPWQRAQSPTPVGPAALPPVESSSLPPVSDGQQQADATPGTPVPRTMPIPRRSPSRRWPPMRRAIRNLSSVT